MDKVKGNFIKRPALVAGILIGVLLVVEFAAVFIFNAARDAAFLSWIQNINAEDISEARAFRYRTDDASDQIVVELTDASYLESLSALLNNVTEAGIYEAPPADGGSYVLSMTDTFSSDKVDKTQSEVLFSVVGDGKVCLTFDDEMERIFCGKGKTWWVDSPELASYISGLVSQREAEVNVIAAMKQVLSSDFINPDELGNVSAKKLASALRYAAEEDKLLSLSDAEVFGETETKWFWELLPALEGDPVTGLSGNDLHFYIRCGLAENIVEISYGKAGIYDTIKIEDKTLYNLVRTSRDYEDEVKNGAYKKYKDIINSEIENVLANMTADLGPFSDFEVTRFVKVFDYDTADDSTIKLYDFKFALLTDSPEELVLAGDMYLDSKTRIQGVDLGQFAVKEKDGEIVASAFMGKDFYYSPESASKGASEAAKERRDAKERISAAFEAAAQATA